MKMYHKTQKRGVSFFALAMMALVFMGVQMNTPRAQNAANEPVSPAKKSDMPTVNPETGAHIIYYIPGQPMSSGVEFGIDAKIEYRVMPGMEDPATLTEEEKMQRDIQAKKAYYESIGVMVDDQLNVVDPAALTEQEKAARILEQKRAMGVLPEQHKPAPATLTDVQAEQTPVQERKAITKPDYVEPAKKNNQ